MSLRSRPPTGGVDPGSRAAAPGIMTRGADVHTATALASPWGRGPLAQRGLLPASSSANPDVDHMAARRVVTRRGRSSHYSPRPPGSHAGRLPRAHLPVAAKPGLGFVVDGGSGRERSRRHGEVARCLSEDWMTTAGWALIGLPGAEYVAATASRRPGSSSTTRCPLTEQPPGRGAASRQAAAQPPASIPAPRRNVPPEAEQRLKAAEPPKASTSPTAPEDTAKKAATSEEETIRSGGAIGASPAR